MVKQTTTEVPLAALSPGAFPTSHRGRVFPDDDRRFHVAAFDSDADPSPDVDPRTIEADRKFPSLLATALGMNGKSPAFYFACGLLLHLQSACQNRERGRLRSAFESMERDEGFAIHVPDAGFAIATGVVQTPREQSEALRRALENCARLCPTSERAMWRDAISDTIELVSDGKLTVGAVFKCLGIETEYTNK